MMWLCAGLWIELKPGIVAELYEYNTITRAIAGAEEVVLMLLLGRELCGFNMIFYDQGI
jgi:hypothetical protein